MGPEVGGIVALGMIGLAAVAIAWINKGGCKLGRHEWTAWSKPSKSGRWSSYHGEYLWFQERTCKNCNMDNFRYYKR